MVGKTESVTRAQKKRMETIKVTGCVCCTLQNWPDSPPEVHHIVEGYRLGHDFTVGLCPWHHRGEAGPEYTKQQRSGSLGPSLAHGSKPFVEVFGSERLLLKVQDYILGRFEADPWLEFAMPRGVVLDIFYFWSDLRLADAEQCTSNTTTSG